MNILQSHLPCSPLDREGGGGTGKQIADRELQELPRKLENTTTWCTNKTTIDTIQSTAAYVDEELTCTYTREKEEGEG